MHHQWVGFYLQGLLWTHEYIVRLDLKTSPAVLWSLVSKQSSLASGISMCYSFQNVFRSSRLKKDIFIPASGFSSHIWACICRRKSLTVYFYRFHTIHHAWQKGAVIRFFMNCFTCNGMRLTFNGCVAQICPATSFLVIIILSANSSRPRFLVS